MADKDDPVDVDDRYFLSPDECYWLAEFCYRGMTLSQAEVLTTLPGVDRHNVREALDAARRRGTLEDDVAHIFDAFS